MNEQQVTAWIHEYVATVSIVSELERYTALTVTVTAEGKSASAGPEEWDVVEGIAQAITAWEAQK